jgi:hypothetical protein
MSAYREAPGELVRRFSSLYNRRPNPRYDVLIDVGLALGGESSVAYRDEGVSLQLTATRDGENTIYEVSVEEKSVYSAVFVASVIGREIEFTTYERGAWERVLADWAEDVQWRANNPEPRVKNRAVA